MSFLLNNKMFYEFYHLPIMFLNIQITLKILHFKTYTTKILLPDHYNDVLAAYTVRYAVHTAGKSICM